MEELPIDSEIIIKVVEDDSRDCNGILIHAKELAKDKQEVRLCVVAMHYDRNAYNDYSDYYWFEYKDGEFYRRMK